MTSLLPSFASSTRPLQRYRMADGSVKGDPSTLTVSKGIVMAVVGPYPGMEQNSALFASFQRRYAHGFPIVRTLRCIPFGGHAANR